MTDDFKKAFAPIAESIIADLPTQYEMPAQIVDWVRELFNYNIPGGKLNRGLSVVDSLRTIRGGELTKEEEHDAQVLGWCIEWTQAFMLISDDIVDHSITRRGQPCWYQREEVGLIAVNDALLVEGSMFMILKKYFRNKPYYVDILELFHEVIYQTELGQTCDLLTAEAGGKVDLSRFSLERYITIVRYKTAFYSFYLPVALALILAGITDEKAFADSRAILIPLGEYFQVQDDYLDCYGSPEVIGKIGTDIEDNKCGWLICQALLRASPEQRAVLEANYARNDPANVAVVKQIYKDLDIAGVFHAYEKDTYDRLTSLIEANSSLVPAKVFTDFMNKIFKRTK